MLVIKESERKHGNRYMLCKCDCGNVKEVMLGNLKQGNVKSCGCLKFDNKHNLSHGHKGTRLYRIWTGMKTRCLNPRAVEYPRYGGRGISICSEWLDASNFISWAISSGYSDNLTLEREDVNGNYEPSNCTWIPLGEQALNRTNTVHVTFEGVTKPLKIWSKEIGIDYPTLFSRIKCRKWSIEKAFTTPVKINRKKVLN